MEVPSALHKRWVQVVLLLAAAAWGHKKWRYARYGSDPLIPDAWHRHPSQHRSYITGLHDFVDLYSQRLPPGGEDGLEAELGVHTRCFTTQVALVTYFCGSEAALDMARQRGEQYTSDDLLGLLDALGELAPAQRGRLLASLLARHTQPPAPAAAGADLAGAAAKDLQSALQLQLSDPTPPQLVLRVHIDGDDVAGHTFVVASWEDPAKGEWWFDIYQSFIGHYTLHQYLWKHPRPHSYEEMVQFLTDVQHIEDAHTWSRSVDATYERLFGVSLARSAGYRGVKLTPAASPAREQPPQPEPGSRHRSRGAPGLQAFDLGEGRALRLQWGLACIIPPNATGLVAPAISA